MDWKQLFFTLQGRINRSKYWLAVLAFIIVWFVLAGTIVASSALGLPRPVLIVLGIVGVVVFIASAIGGVAVGTKRAHDRGKSAWWLILFYLVPGVLQGLARPTDSWILNSAAFVIGVWGLIELGFLRGTEGTNDYGPDPQEEKLERH